MKTLITLTSLPKKFSIKNDTDTAIQLPIYSDNEVFTLNPGDELVYRVESAREGMFYYTTCSALGLTFAEVVPTGKG